jgi:hypothetical protein
MRGLVKSTPQAEAPCADAFDAVALVQIRRASAVAKDAAKYSARKAAAVEVGGGGVESDSADAQPQLLSFRRKWRERGGRI